MNIFGSFPFSTNPSQPFGQRLIFLSEAKFSLLHFGQFPQQLFLIGQELLGNFNERLHQQVACAAATAGVGHSAAADAERRIRELGQRLNLGVTSIREITPSLEDIFVSVVTKRRQ